jgi:hypothetical protein
MELSAVAHAADRKEGTMTFEKLRARIVELERQRDLALDGEQAKAREIAALVNRVDTQSEMIECWSEYIDNLESALRGVVIRHDDGGEDCWCTAPLMEPGVHYEPCNAARFALGITQAPR